MTSQHYKEPVVLHCNGGQKFNYVNYQNADFSSCFLANITVILGPIRIKQNLA